MCSEVVVLPASMWAMMPRLRILFKSRAGVLAAIGVSSKHTQTTETQRTQRRQTERKRKGSRHYGQALSSILSVRLLCVLCVSVVQSPCHHAKCENALLASAILMVFSRLVMASPSR